MNERCATPTVSVVIPTWQRQDDVRRLLLALDRQEYPRDRFEVIVAIDGSTDGTLEMARALEVGYRLRAHWQANGGRASACNAGLRDATGEFVVILDDDMEPAPGLLRAHVAAHLAEPAARLGVVGAVPVRVTERDGPVTRYIAGRFERLQRTLATAGDDWPIHYFYSGNFSVRRDALLALGGYDETFRVYGKEDVELGWRLRASGVRLVFCSEALAWQRYGKDAVALARDNLHEARSELQLLDKHPELLPGSRLSRFAERSWRWRLLRGALLEAMRIAPLRVAIPRALGVLEWPALRRRDWSPLYELVCEACFWAGVRDELRRRDTIGHGPLALRRWAGGTFA